MLGGATKPVDLQIEEKIDAWKQDGRLVDRTSEMIWRDVLKREATPKPVYLAYRGRRRRH
jgi:hypothetical protein